MKVVWCDEIFEKSGREGEGERERERKEELSIARCLRERKEAKNDRTD